MLKDNALITVADQRAYLEIPDNSKDEILEVLINAVSETFENFVPRKFKMVKSEDVYFDGDGTSFLSLPHWPIISVTSIYIGDSLLSNSDYAIFNDLGYVRLKSTTQNLLTGSSLVPNVFTRGVQNIKATYEGGYILVQSMKFNSGSKVPEIGQTLVGAVSAKEADVVKVLITSGTWAGGDAKGEIILINSTGTFQDDEDVNVKGGDTNILTVDGATAGEAVNVPSDLKLACMKQVAHEYQQFKGKNWGESSRSAADGSISMFREIDLLEDVKLVLSKYRKAAI